MEVSYHNRIEDFVETSSHSKNKTYNRKKRRQFFWATFLLLQWVLFTVYLLLEVLEVQVLFYPIVLCIDIGFILLRNRYLDSVITRLVQYKFESQYYHKKEKKIQLTNEGIDFFVGDISGHLPWTSVNSHEIINEYLYVNTNLISFLIPARAFIKREDFLKFHDYISEKLVEFEKEPKRKTEISPKIINYPIFILISLLFIPIVGIIFLRNYTENSTVSKNAQKMWYSAIQEGDYTDIYDFCTLSFKKEVSQDELNEFLIKCHDEIGIVTGTSITKTAYVTKNIKGGGRVKKAFIFMDLIGGNSAIEIKSCFWKLGNLWLLNGFEIKSKGLYLTTINDVDKQDLNEMVYFDNNNK